MKGVENLIILWIQENNTSFIPILLVARIIAVILLLVLLVLLLRFIKTNNLEKRFSKYSVNTKKSKEKSLTERIKNIYNSLVNKLSISLKKYNFIERISKRYKKYSEVFEIEDEVSIISKKILIAILYLIIVFILRLKDGFPNFYEILFSFIIGYYSLDLYYIYKFNMLKRQIENDMLQAITIMKNAFKSGRSIIQAIDMVANDIKGPISNEFKKISLEINYGLDVEVAFKRFAERINLDEAVYLTSSLSVLNKTGGNIIEVFDTIEETLMNRKKLKNELDSLTGSSKLIMWVLIIVPVLFVILISVINPGYFNPLFTNALGIVLLIIMVTIYILYIYVVTKIMKVRM